MVVLFESSAIPHRGGARGSMVVTIPLNTKVVATFRNDATTPHSALIVGYSKTFPAKTPAPTFTGAASADHLNGAERGDPATPFRFTASRAGMYLLICGVRGHDSAGMWGLGDLQPALLAIGSLPVYACQPDLAHAG